MYHLNIDPCEPSPNLSLPGSTYAAVAVRVVGVGFGGSFSREGRPVGAIAAGVVGTIAVAVGVVGVGFGGSFSRESV